ncbi:2815_t:CDS:2 [Acaulospora morrowiae]|uniref:2815_t:CDS:1 n=1 Tax=Acaulospora morrowiae TaxID=94023 RepID=A0A9N9I2F0_9GLOM|nr:2815_t:CDS:2 [Acaulospora morrowiae]
MGNSMNKEKGEETVDGGQLVPHGIYKGPQDWDVRCVRRLIIERKLAPFYKGLADYDESWDEVTLTTHNLPKNGEVKKSGAFNGELHTQGNQVLRRSATLNTVGTAKGKEVSTTKSLEAQLYKGAAECPICFLYYPRNINHSRCCDQPICTECFVQIKRPESGTLGANNSPAVCPFCVEPNFGVCYKPPPFSAGIGSENMPNAIHNFNIPPLPTSSSSSSLNVPEGGKTRRRSVSHKNPDVVTTDQIRPDWAARALQQSSRQSSSARRSPTATSSGNPRRIVIRSQGTSTNTPSRRNNTSAVAPEYGGYLAAMRMGTDLEELMVMEAIRLSLLEQDERERGEREERERAERSQDENSNDAASSEDSASGTITNPHLSSNEEGVDEVVVHENQQRNENDDSVVESSQLEVEAHFSEQMPTDNSDDDEISSTSHSHGYTSTNVSTPITTSTEGGTIVSTSALSSSTGSGLSSPSTTNSTNDALPTSYSQNNGNNTSEIAEIVEDSSEGVLSDNGAENELSSFEVGDREGQTSEHANDIKKPDVIILPSTSLVEEAIVRNETDDDTRDARRGSWEHA